MIIFSLICSSYDVHLPNKLSFLCQDRLLRMRTNFKKIHINEPHSMPKRRFIEPRHGNQILRTGYMIDEVTFLPIIKIWL